MFKLLLSFFYIESKIRLSYPFYKDRIIEKYCFQRFLDFLHLIAFNNGLTTFAALKWTMRTRFTTSSSQRGKDRFLLETEHMSYLNISLGIATQLSRAEEAIGRRADRWNFVVHKWRWRRCQKFALSLHLFSQSWISGFCDSLLNRMLHKTQTNSAFYSIFLATLGQKSSDAWPGCYLSDLLS